MADMTIVERVANRLASQGQRHYDTIARAAIDEVFEWLRPTEQGLNLGHDDCGICEDARRDETILLWLTAKRKEALGE